MPHIALFAFVAARHAPVAGGVLGMGQRSAACWPGLRAGFGALAVALTVWGCGGGGAASTTSAPGQGEREAPVMTSITFVSGGDHTAKIDGVPSVEIQALAADNIDVTAYCATPSDAPPSAKDACFAEKNNLTMPVGPAWHVWAKDAAGNVSAGMALPPLCSADAQAASDASALPTVCIKTDAGEMVLALEIEKAPLSVANFQQYVRDGFYAGVVFHRVISTFMVQTGGFVVDGSGRAKKEATYEPIKLETTTDTGLSNSTGAVAMARTTEPDSATSEFFINVVDNKSLDASGDTAPGKGYAVFAHVIYGLDTTVQTIRRMPVVRNSQNELSAPVDNLFIQWAYLMKP